MPIIKDIPVNDYVTCGYHEVNEIARFHSRRNMKVRLDSWPTKEDKEAGKPPVSPQIVLMVPLFKENFHEEDEFVEDEEGKQIPTGNKLRVQDPSDYPEEKMKSGNIVHRAEKMICVMLEQWKDGTVVDE